MRAGLELIGAIAKLGVPAPLHPHIGIGTGLMMVGTSTGAGPPDEFAATGQALNLALRLQSVAPSESVLITSHTTKALRMVRHHLVEELRPLCVSVLESDLESRNQLESSVGSIAERLSRADSSVLEADAKRLEEERRTLLSKLEKVRTELIEARSDEYRDIVVAGEAWPPSDAARKVSAEQNVSGWVPGPVSPSAPLPLSVGELIDLYHTNVTVARQHEIELSGPLPDPSEIANPQDFRAALVERERLHKEDLSVGSHLWRPDSSVDAQRVEVMA